MTIITKKQDMSQELSCFVRNIFLDVSMSVSPKHACILVDVTVEDLELFIRQSKGKEKTFYPLSGMKGDVKKYFPDSSYKVTEVAYQMTYREFDFRVICLQITNRSNCRKLHVVPWYLTPFRPYPVFVMILAALFYTLGSSLSYAAAVVKEIFDTTISHMEVARDVRYLNQFTIHERSPDMPSINQLHNWEAAREYLVDDKIFSEVKQQQFEMRYSHDDLKVDLHFFDEICISELMDCLSGMLVLRRLSVNTSNRHESQRQYSPRIRKRPLVKHISSADRLLIENFIVGVSLRLVLNIAIQFHRFLF